MKGEDQNLLFSSNNCTVDIFTIFLIFRKLPTLVQYVVKKERTVRMQFYMLPFNSLKFVHKYRYINSYFEYVNFVLHKICTYI